MEDEQHDLISESNALELFGHTLEGRINGLEGPIEKDGMGIAAASMAEFFFVLDKAVTKEERSVYLRSRKGPNGEIWRNDQFEMKEYTGDTQTKNMKLWYYGRDKRTSKKNPIAKFAVFHKGNPHGYWVCEDAPKGRLRPGQGEEIMVDKGVFGDRDNNEIE
jgi:hypothetical protein